MIKAKKTDLWLRQKNLYAGVPQIEPTFGKQTIHTSKGKDSKVCNVVVVADLHAGCRLGLCPPAPRNLDDGGKYVPSKYQNQMWRLWEEFWAVHVPEFCHNEPFAVVVNGDALEGVHHHAVTQISQNLADQFAIAHDILKPVVDLCEGRYYHIRGTEAHVGPSASDEERLAQSLHAVKDEDGRSARWEIYFKIKKSLIHVSHHIGIAGSMAYETSALSRELAEAYLESGRWGNEPPDVIIRSHRHRNSEVRIQTKRGFCTVATTAAWQLKTPYTFRVAGARQALPQIGGTVIRIGDHDTYTRHKVWTIGRPKEVKL